MCVWIWKFPCCKNNLSSLANFSFHTTSPKHTHSFGFNSSMGLNIDVNYHWYFACALDFSFQFASVYLLIIVITLLLYHAQLDLAWDFYSIISYIDFEGNTFLVEIFCCRTHYVSNEFRIFSSRLLATVNFCRFPLLWLPLYNLSISPCK